MYIYSAFASDRFSYINDLISKTEYVFFLVGSSGNGKNYLMKKIGKYFENKSTYFFCSFDNDSLDGVLIDKKILVFDSVYPHNVLPKLYKIDGEIINLGDGIDVPNNEFGYIKSIFTKEKDAKYEYIKYGTILHNLLDIEYNYYDNLSLQSQKNQIKDLVDSLKFKDYNNIIKDVFYLKEYTGSKNKISINCSNKMLAEYLLKNMDKLIYNKGIQHITYHNPYNEKFVKAIETDNFYIGTNQSYGQNIDIYGENIIDSINTRQIEAKINKIKKEALYLHKKLERAYRPYIDFENNDRLYEQIINKTNKIIGRI